MSLLPFNLCQLSIWFKVFREITKVKIHVTPMGWAVNNQYCECVLHFVPVYYGIDKGSCTSLTLPQQELHLHKPDTAAGGMYHVI